MEDIEKFRKLKVWQKTRELVVEIYRITENFPKHELYCLVSQMRRAVISILANIAEGSKRSTAKDRCHFYTMADTSLEEVKCFLIISYDLKYVSAEEGKVLTERSREIGRMLNGLIKKQR